MGPTQVGESIRPTDRESLYDCYRIDTFISNKFECIFEYMGDIVCE